MGYFQWLCYITRGYFYWNHRQWGRFQPWEVTASYIGVMCILNNLNVGWPSPNNPNFFYAISNSWLPFVDYCWLLYVSRFGHSWPPNLPLFRCGSNPCTPSCSHQKKCLWKFIPSKNLAKWRFPKSSGSSYQPFFFGIFILNQPALGVPLPTARLVFRLPRRRGARQGGWQEPWKLRWPRLMIY